MRIARFEHLHADAGWRVFSFLKIVTDDGLVGWSEYYDGYGAGGVTAPLRSLDDIRQAGRDVVARGFKALKTNPCDLLPGWTKFSSGFRAMPGFLDRAPEPRFLDEITQLLGAFRDGIGAETGLMLDLN